MSLAGFMADVSGQYFFVGEMGGNACGVGDVATAITEYVNDKSVAYGEIGEYLIQISIAYLRGEAFVTHIADVVFEYFILDDCGGTVVGTGFTQIGVFYNIFAEVTRIVLIPFVIIRYIVGGS